MGTICRPYEGMEPYIFISYARKDKERVLPLLNAISGAGYRLWYDAGIHWTDEWSDEIATHLAGSAVLLAFHSAASAQSEHCRAEIHYGRSKKRPILSVYLDDDVELPPGLEMYLNLYQAVKLSQFPNEAAFVSRMGEEVTFAPCRASVWNKTGEIQWYLNADGILTISRNEDMDIIWPTGSIPFYQNDLVNGSTAPWSPYRDKILSVVIQDTINDLGMNAFRNCRMLKSVTIPNGITSTGSRTFRNCVNLMNVDIPDSITTIDDWTFANCVKLENIRISDNAVYIGEGSFDGCSSLTSVEFPDSVSIIANWAFRGCARLTAVEVPVSANIHPHAFDPHTCISYRNAG